MPIEGVQQPEILAIDDELRLRKFDNEFTFALEWYQDTELVKLVDGVDVPYSEEKLERMYHYLDRIGELYFIEKKLNDVWTPVGDVCMWKTDMPITISRPFWKQGIGKRCILRLLKRAKELGWQNCFVNEIYHYNIGSQRLFECCGFRLYEENEVGKRYHIEL